MKKYRLFASEAEIKYRELKASGFTPGETMYYSLKRGNADTETIGIFDSMYEALHELHMCGNTTFTQGSAPTGTYYLVREYGVEEIELDEDGDVIQGGDILAYSVASYALQEVLNEAE